jgi:hypothetical protein
MLETPGRPGSPGCFRRSTAVAGNPGGPPSQGGSAGSNPVGATIEKPLLRQGFSSCRTPWRCPQFRRRGLGQSRITTGGTRWRKIQGITQTAVPGECVQVARSGDEDPRQSVTHAGRRLSNRIGEPRILSLDKMCGQGRLHTLIWFQQTPTVDQAAP